MPDDLLNQLQLTIQTCREIEKALKSGRDLTMEEAQKGARDLREMGSSLSVVWRRHVDNRKTAEFERLRRMSEGQYYAASFKPKNSS